MNTDFLTSNLEHEKTTKKYRSTVVKNYTPNLINISRKMWTYFGYSGLINPWHDSTESINFGADSIYNFIEYLTVENMSLESYAIFALSVASYERFEAPTKLFANKAERSWLKKLRRHSDTSELMDHSAYLLLKFFEKQIEQKGKAFINKTSVVKKDEKGLHLEGYHRLVDRVRQLQSNSVNAEMWLNTKFDKVAQAFPKDVVNFRTIVNVNGFDPDLEELKKVYSDPWREIKQFLGLSLDCEIADGYIPKGWAVSSDDRADITKVVRITGDGYYYYPEGTQRRGKRHYAGNSYFVIKCDPSNFAMFKENWLDPRMLSISPTFEEYFRFGAYPEMWDSEGNSTNGRGKSIRWRKA